MFLKDHMCSFGGGGTCRASSSTDLCPGHRCAITRSCRVLCMSFTPWSCGSVPKHADKLIDGKLYVMALNHGLLKQWMKGIQTIKSEQEIPHLVGKFKELILFFCSRWAGKYWEIFWKGYIYGVSCAQHNCSLKYLLLLEHFALLEPFLMLASWETPLVAVFICCPLIEQSPCSSQKVCFFTQIHPGYMGQENHHLIFWSKSYVACGAAPSSCYRGECVLFFSLYLVTV